MSKEGDFTFTWRVRNFSMCPVKVGEIFSSPVFRVSKFGNSEWELSLYPKGTKTYKDSIACYLTCKCLGTNQCTISIKFSLCIACNKRSTENTYKLNENCGFANFISAKDILKENEKYLPNDILTIKCTMNCKDPIKVKTIEEVIAEDKTISDSICQKNPTYINQCCIETTIHEETKSFIWTIQRLQSFSCNKSLLLPVFSAVKAIPSFYIRLYKMVESPIVIEIKRTKNSISKNLFIKCRLSVINTENDVKYCAKGDFLFQSVDDVWTFPPFLQQSDLEKDGYLESTDGKLHLQFHFAFSVDGQMHHSEKQDWNRVFLPPKRELPIKLFSELTTDDEQSVVTLKAGDHTFKVHRSILDSKSEVFHAMFESDMKEKQAGIVDIIDVDPQFLVSHCSGVTFVHY